MPEKGRHTTSGLQHGLVGIEIETVDPLNIQRDLLFQQFSQILFYHRTGSGWHLGDSPSRRMFGYDRSLVLLMTNRGHLRSCRSEAKPR